MKPINTRSVPISHEMYMKIRNKQNELLEISKNVISMRDLIDVVVKSTIDSVHFEQDGTGWILSTDPEPIDIEKLKDDEVTQNEQPIPFEFGKSIPEQPIKRRIIRRTWKKEVTHEPNREKV